MNAQALAKPMRPSFKHLLASLGLLSSLMLAQAAQAACTIRWAASSNTVYIEQPITCTLTDIYTASLPENYPILDQVAAPSGSTSKIWLLKANLILSNGATLTLKGSSLGGDVDELRLMSQNSSTITSDVFVRADWGNIFIDTLKVTSWNPAVNGPDTEYATYGRAYVGVRSRLASDGVTPLESRMDIKNSDLGYLGFDGAEAYGLVWKVSSPLNTFNTVDVLGDIINNKIHNN